MSEPSSEVQFSLESTIKAVNELEKDINNRQLITRPFDQHPFDIVACELLAKAFALSRSAILLVEHGFSDEAFGLCRSIYESAMYLRYITRDSSKLDERALAFLKFGRDSKAFWLHILKDSAALTPDELKEMEDYAADNEIPTDPKIMMRPWSGVKDMIRTTSQESHPLDAPALTKSIRDRQRAFAYTDTSCYVHCTQPGLNNYTVDEGQPIQVGNAHEGSIDNEPKTCVAIQFHLAEIYRYCMFGMGVLPLEAFLTSDDKAPTDDPGQHESFH